MGTVRTLGYQAVLVVVSMLFVAAIVMGVYDPEAPNAAGWNPMAVGSVLITVLVAGRACMLGVTVRSDDVVVRNLAWSHRLPRAEISDVRVVNYDGYLGGRPWRSWWWKTVRLTMVSGREVTACGLLGRRTVITRAVAELRSLVGMPEPMPSTSHRAARPTPNSPSVES